MQATAELIFTGDELLRGDIVNTNQAYLGERLLELGLFVTHALSVTDDRASCAAAVRAALARGPEVVVVSGGLGPTEDDVTREAVADALGLDLVLHPELLAEIATRFDRYGLRMSPSNRRQAYLPVGAAALPFTGTAPGFWIETGPTLLVALPGVPAELHTMWKEHVQPLVQRRLGYGQGDTTGGQAAHQHGVLVRRLRVEGIGEGALADALKDLPWRQQRVQMGTRAALDGLTVILRGGPDAESRQAVAVLERRVREILGDKVFGEDADDLAEVVGGLLRCRGLTVATAESCTGGLVAKRITDVPGSSEYFVGGVVSYSNELKRRLLGVDECLLAEYGAVSEQVAQAMAEGAAQRLGADCAVATTGIAGPGGGTSDKPVGLVYIGTCVEGRCEVGRFTMLGNRPEVRERTAQTALNLLRRRLLPPRA